MQFFTSVDRDRAIDAMLEHAGVADRALQGLLSGIKRRARARAVITFVQSLQPAPPDMTITTTRALMLALFGRAVSVNDLHRYFSTPGRKANDRADPVVLESWFEPNRARLRQDAAQLMLDLEVAWALFTQEAADEAGRLRKGRASREQENETRKQRQGNP
jgi:hypothetical protein